MIYEIWSGGTEFGVFKMQPKTSGDMYLATPSYSRSRVLVYLSERYVEEHGQSGLGDFELKLNRLLDEIEADPIRHGRYQVVDV